MLQTNPIHLYNLGEVQRRAQVLVNVTLDNESFINDAFAIDNRQEAYELAYANLLNPIDRSVGQGEIVFQCLPASLGGDQIAPVRSVLNGIPINKAPDGFVLDEKRHARYQKQQLMAGIRIVGIAQDAIKYEEKFMNGCPAVINGTKTVRHTGQDPIYAGDIVFAKFPATSNKGTRAVFETATLTPKNLTEEVMRDETLEVICQTVAFREFMVRMLNLGAQAQAGATAAAALEAAFKPVPVPWILDETRSNDIIDALIKMGDTTIKDQFVSSFFPVAGMFIGTIASRIIGIAMSASTKVSQPDNTQIEQFDLMVTATARNPVILASMC